MSLISKQLAGLCPFHDDHEPSLIVDPKKQLWNCLGACSEGGDVYKWVMKREGLDFKAAHRLLAALTLLAPGEAAEEDDGPNTEGGVNDLLWLSRVVEHYHRRLLETPAAQDYLRSRGIVAPEFGGAFRVGYADGTLLQVISPEGKRALKRIGVITEGGRELMGGCVVFPLLDAASGQAVNLYGRYAGKHERCDLPGAQHLYLPGARRGVFNPQGARNTDEVIITESVVDAAAVWSVGLRNVMPAYGVNGLTDEIITHLQECRVKRAALMLDSDDADEYAAQKFGERLKEINVASRRVKLPAKDASEYIASGATADELRARLSAPDEPGGAEGRRGEIELEKEADGSLRCVIGGREYRARGLQASGLDRLKINLRVKVGGAFHLDTIDLYQARSRSNFAQTAGKLCRVDEQELGADLLSLVDLLEGARLEMRKATGGEEAAEMSQADKEQALSFLRDPKLIERIVEDFHRCGFEGERETMLVAYLSAISRHLNEPYCVLVMARSGAGKSALQDAVCGFVPPEELVRVTRLTGQALFYKDPDSLKYKVLAIAEEEGALQAAYSLRTLASDQRFQIAATRTDPATGKLITEHYEVNGPVSIITTTSPEAFDEETRSRFVELTLDESREQTRAILERQRWNRSLEGILERKSAEGVRRLHHNAQRLLRKIEVANPYFKELKYPEDQLILRREQKKYLSLIEAIAYLHQYQREIKHGESRDGLGQAEYVEVRPEDIALGNELAQAALSRALDELAPPVRGLYEEIKGLCERRAKEEGCEPDQIRLTRREIRAQTGWSDWQVRTH